MINLFLGGFCNFHYVRREFYDYVLLHVISVICKKCVFFFFATDNDKRGFQKFCSSQNL